jgi:hypothetical protein
MVSKRFAFVLLLIVALCVYFAPFSGITAQPEASPAASPGASPEASPVVGGEIVHHPGELVFPRAPACIDCYFGLWQLTIPPGESTTVDRLAGSIGGYTAQGSVTLSPGSPSFPAGGGPIREFRGFAWPEVEPGQQVTVTNELADQPAIVYIFGIVEGRTAVASPSLELLGGASFQAQPRQNYYFLVGQLIVEAEGDEVVFDPRAWPAVLNIPEGLVQVTTAAAALEFGDVAIDVASFDEAGPGVQVLEPATIVRLVRAEDAQGEMIVWFTGVLAYDPEGDPGCGWRCRG